jgi:hypothetical protein
MSGRGARVDGPIAKDAPDRESLQKPCSRHANSTHFARDSAQKRLSMGNSRQPVRPERNFSRGLCAKQGGSRSAPLRNSQPSKPTSAQFHNPLSEHFRPCHNPQDIHSALSPVPKGRGTLRQAQAGSGHLACPTQAKLRSTRRTKVWPRGPRDGAPAPGTWRIAARRTLTKTA